MTHLALICGLERLWPTYEDGKWHFSLQLSTALLDGAGDEGDRDRLELWNWKITGVKVWIEDAASSIEGDVLPCEHDAKVDIHALLQGEFRRSVPPTPESLLWQPQLGPEHEFESERLARNALAYFSTLPTPIPQVANLSLAFKIDAQDDSLQGKRLVAAPIVQIVGHEPERAPSDLTLFPSPENRGHLVWPYNVVASEPRLSAFLVPWTISDKPQAGLKPTQIRLGSLLAKPPEDSKGLSSEDWLSRLIQRGADGFDLAARTIEVLRDQTGISDENARAIAQAAVGLLRDRAHTGHLPGPDGDRLADDLLQRCGFEEDGGAVDRGLAASVVAALNAYELEQLNDTPGARWLGLLREEVPPQSFPSEIFQSGEIVIPESGLANRLGQLHLALQDDDVLRRLLWRQWQAAIERSQRITLGDDPAEFYTVVNTEHPFHGDEEHRGDFVLAPGETQVLTLAEIVHARQQVFRFVCRPGSLESGPEPGNEFGFRVETTEDGLKVICLVAGTEVHEETQSGRGAYHLRLRVQHQGFKPNDPEKALFQIVFQFGRESAGTERFTDLFTQDDFELPVVETRYSRLVVDSTSTSKPTFTLPSALSMANGDDVLEAWDESAFHKPGVVWQTCAGLLRDRVLPQLDLRALYARTVFAPVVRKLATITSVQPEAIHTALEILYEGTFQAYLEQRLASFAGSSVYGTYRPRVELTTEQEGRIKTQITNFTKGNEDAEGFVGDRMYPSSVQLEDTSPTEIPHAVSLTIDQSQGFEEDDLSKDIDIQRKIQGVAVFLRVAEEGKLWRCLNVARPLLPQDDGTLQSIAGLNEVLVPCRLSYQNDMRQALVTYDNHPLTAGSFAVGIGDGAISALSEVGADDTPMLAFEQLKGAEHPWAVLPGLVFGRKYQAFVAAVGPGGALPEFLANGHPAKLKAFSEEFDPDLAEYLYKFEYRRRVRVGSPRILPLPDTGTLAPREVTRLPVFDRETVTPLFSEPLDLQPPEEAKIPDSDRALLLLAPEAGGWRHPHTYKFHLRPPATDLQTWDRWVANDPNNEVQPSHRISVWTAFHNPARQSDIPATEETDRSLDDPAVTAFFVELVRLEVEGSSERHTALVKIQRNVESDQPMGAAQAKAIPSTIRLKKEAGEEEPLRVSDELEIVVPEGQIWELRLFPAVKKEHFEGDGRRFGPSKDVLEPEGAIEYGDYLLFTPSRLVIETAIGTLPGSKALWHAMVPRFDGARAIVELDSDVANDEKMIWIKDLTFSRQLWRFTGRPIEPFPFTALEGAETESTDLAEIHRWEVQGFGDRPDEDRLFRSSEALLEKITPIFEEDLSGDPRARLYRFQLTAASRYRGLRVNPDDLEVAARRGGRNELPWRRLFVPSRIPLSELPQLTPEGEPSQPSKTQVPAPAVKLVLPLTETASDNDTVPPLLVILNEPWYQVGGLNEFLEADVEVVTEHGDIEKDCGKASGPETRQQVGFDPILSGEAWPTEPQIGFRTERLFGRTFDTDTDAPRFVSTSVLLEPEYEGDAPLDWTFTKLRFQRVLKAEGESSNEERRSEPTAPYWVQLLPDSSRFKIRGRETTIRVQDLRLHSEQVPSGIALSLREETGEKLALESAVQRDANTPAKHELWVLVLEVIRDAANRRDLRYFGLYRWEEGLDLVATSGTARQDRPAELTAWVIETQRRHDTEVDDLWKELFANKGDMDSVDPNGRFEKDAAIRIVHISRPIRGAGQKVAS